MSLISMLKRPGPSGFGYGSTAEETLGGVDLRGKTMLITGVNSGLGSETLRVLVKHGATVIGAARTLEKARAACDPHGEKAIPVACELSEPLSVIQCVEEVTGHCDWLAAIITNAGIMALPEREVKHGLELQFLTNHIGHFLLVTRLLDHLGNHGRVVIVSSSAHKMAPKGGIRFDALDGEGWYKPWEAYGQSKLANALFARELARRFEGSGRVANAVHPGVIQTNLGRHMKGANVFYAVGNALFMKNIPQGAATQTWLAGHPDGAKLNGEYVADVNVAKSNDLARDDDLAKKLWTTSEAIVNDISRG